MTDGDDANDGLTLSRIAIERLRREKYPFIRRRGFRKSINTLLLKRYNVDDKLGAFGLVPDGWFIEMHPADMNWPLVTAIEIEDTNFISASKMRRYVNLWENLDFESVSLRVLVFDRYGDNERELDLLNAWRCFRRSRQLMAA